MLNYQAAANEGAAILGLLVLCTLSPMFFLIGWRIIVQYFKWALPEPDTMRDTMYDACMDALADSRGDPQTIELEVNQ